ncbi:MAG: hypothetical protein IPI67_37055 [Myxococcales bacterium]|nr:hypothetical protein [Myxococcales bacterium]
MKQSALLGLCFVFFSCGNEDSVGQQKTFTRDELLDPGTCETCHSEHYREWSGSMHAYAAEDPVFLAMNRRGQEETQGALGSFCVQCHAPMAVREGLTTDGLNLAQLPAPMRGITCYFCHDATGVEGTHNAPIVLAGSTTMHGGIEDPVENPAHASKHSKLHDRRYPEESAAFCGSCHDIVTPSPPAPAVVALERTYAEWLGTVFHGAPQDGGLACTSCHMPGSDGLAADFPGTRPRRVHDHSTPGVDLALTPFPEAEAQKALVEQELDQTLRFEICVRQLPGAFTLQVTLENVAAGHHFPSGAAQDRRMWAELAASSAGALLYESGNVPKAQAAATFADPDLWLIRDVALGSDGKEAHMFWDIAKYESRTIPGAVTFEVTHPDYLATHLPRRYPLDETKTIPGAPDRVTLKLWVEPIGREVLDDLVESGHLDAAIRDAMPRHALLPARGTSELALEWTPELTKDPALGYVKQVEGINSKCVSSAPTASR